MAETISDKLNEEKEEEVQGTFFVYFKFEPTQSIRYGYSYGWNDLGKFINYRRTNYSMEPLKETTQNILNKYVEGQIIS